MDESGTGHAHPAEANVYLWWGVGSHAAMQQAGRPTVWLTINEVPTGSSSGHPDWRRGVKMPLHASFLGRKKRQKEGKREEKAAADVLDLLSSHVREVAGCQRESDGCFCAGSLVRSHLKRKVPCVGVWQTWDSVTLSSVSLLRPSVSRFLNVAVWRRVIILNPFCLNVSPNSNRTKSSEKNQADFHHKPDRK